MNVDLPQGQIANLEAQAETSTGQVFPLTIEFVGAVPNFSWLKQIVVKLPDEIANSNEVNVSLKTGLFTSNPVIVKLKP